MIGKGKLLKLPKVSFDGIGSAHTDFPDGDSSDNDVATTTDKDWKGSLLGGKNRFAWPIAWTPPMLSRWKGLDDDQAFLDSFAKSVPRTWLGKEGGLPRVPRALLYGTASVFGGSFATAMSDLLAPLAEALGNANVLACEGWRTGGRTLLGLTFPPYGYTPAAEILFGGEANFACPKVRVEDWLAGEVLYVEFFESTNTIGHFHDFNGSGDTLETYASLIPATLASVQGMGDRHAKYKRLMFCHSVGVHDFSALTQAVVAQTNDDRDVLVPYTSLPTAMVDDSGWRIRLTQEIQDFFGL